MHQRRQRRRRLKSVSKQIFSTRSISWAGTNRPWEHERFHASGFSRGAPLESPRSRVARAPLTKAWAPPLIRRRLRPAPRRPPLRAARRPLRHLLRASSARSGHRSASVRTRRTHVSTARTGSTRPARPGAGAFKERARRADAATSARSARRRAEPERPASRGASRALRPPRWTPQANSTIARATTSDG